MSPEIVTVTPNPSLDVTYSLTGLYPGQTHRMFPGTHRAGGKGLNVARVLHQMDTPAVAIATCGGPTGEEFVRELTSSGIDHVLIPVDAETRRSLAFLDSGSGEVSIFNERGRCIADADYDQLRSAVALRLGQAGCVVGSGSLPEGAPGSFYPRLVQEAHSAHVPCIIDTSGPSLLAAARAGADVLKPNVQELLEATGCEAVGDAARRLLLLGAGSVFVSAGPDGMKYFERSHPGYLHASLPEPLAGNPTGAGDAAVAAIAVGLSAAAFDPEATLRRAVAWSAAAVLAPAAGELHSDYAVLEDRVVLTTYPAAKE